MLSAAGWVDAAAVAAVFAPPVAVGFTPLDPAVFAPRALPDFVPLLVGFVPRLVDSGQVSQVDLDQADPGFAHLRPRPGAMACRRLLQPGIPSPGDHLRSGPAIAVSSVDLTTSIITTYFSTIVLALHADRLSSSEVGLVSAPVRFLDGPSLDRLSMDLPTIRITPTTDTAQPHQRSQL